MNYLLLPSGDRIYVGDIVTLSRFPGTKWIVQNGWYFYEGRQQNGWYFASIPEDSVIPVDESDLISLTIVATNNTHNCPPMYPGGAPECHPHPHPPCHPHPGPGHGPGHDDTTHKTMITVDTIAQRNELSSKYLQHGRIVRVNDVEGKIRYFEWDAINFTWIDAQFEQQQDSDKTLDIFKDEVVIDSTESWEDSDEKVATCGAIAKYLDEVAGSPTWGSIQ